MFINRVLFILVFSILVASALFASDKYFVDPAHTTIGFSVKHLVISTVPGLFQEFDIDLLYDEKNISKSSVKATIKAASIFTDDETRDGHLRSADFFDVEKYPEITFVSNRISKTDDGYVAKGILTMKDVSKEVKIPFKILGIVKDPWGNTKMGIEGALTVDRQEFKVTWNKILDTGGVLVGDDVIIELNVQMQKAA
jgi:polyisoprenoid-binding protein YceI